MEGGDLWAMAILLSAKKRLFLQKEAFFGHQKFANFDLKLPQKQALKTRKCWRAIFMILKPDMFFCGCFPFFVFFLLKLFFSSSSCFLPFLISDFLLLLLWLRSKRRIKTERKKERKQRKEERQKGRKERKTERKKESKEKRKEGRKEGKKERKGRKKGKKERERERER